MRAQLAAVSRTTSSMVSAMSAPAAVSASILLCALPVLPLMIAPAWPMRLPGGAVRPEMNATTGLSKPVSRIHAAAFSSSEPPISPMSTTARVSGSSAKRWSTSGKLRPITGSPPIPTDVV